MYKRQVQLAVLIKSVRLQCGFVKLFDLRVQTVIVEGIRSAGLVFHVQMCIRDRFMKDHPQAPVRLLHQDEEQGLIPTRDYGLNHATGDILGRFDADCMIRPDWVEVVSGIFTEDPEAMGATGPVMYYDLPSRHFGLRGDNSTRKDVYKRQMVTLVTGSVSFMAAATSA